ncbi:hypothetical protein RB213_014982 [Colletotrichum asianum]
MGRAIRRSCFWCFWGSRPLALLFAPLSVLQRCEYSIPGSSTTGQPKLLGSHCYCAAGPIAALWLCVRIFHDGRALFKVGCIISPLPVSSLFPCLNRAAPSCKVLVADTACQGIVTWTKGSTARSSTTRAKITCFSSFVCMMRRVASFFGFPGTPFQVPSLRGREGWPGFASLSTDDGPGPFRSSDTFRTRVPRERKKQTKRPRDSKNNPNVRYFAHKPEPRAGRGKARRYRKRPGASRQVPQYICTLFC